MRPQALLVGGRSQGSAFGFAAAVDGSSPCGSVRVARRSPATPASGLAPARVVAPCPLANTRTGVLGSRAGVLRGPSAGSEGRVAMSARIHSPRTWSWSSLLGRTSNPVNWTVSPVSSRSNPELGLRAASPATMTIRAARASRGLASAPVPSGPGKVTVTRAQSAPARTLAVSHSVRSHMTVRAIDSIRSAAFHPTAHT